MKLLAVTVLTSYDDGDLHEAGYRLGVTDWSRRARDRLRCSASMGWSARRKRPPRCAGSSAKVHLVTPGIRPVGSSTDDQKRIVTPARAIAAGADYLVVGRPIDGAADPRAAADAIVAEIAQALDQQAT